MSFEQDLMFFNELYLKRGSKGCLFKVWKYFFYLLSEKKKKLRAKI